MHHRAGSTDHPAVLRTGADSLADLLSLFALPNLHEWLLVYVSHRALEVLSLHAIARQHLAPWVDEEVGRTCLARQHTLATFNIVDESHVEPSAEPALRMLFLQLPFDELLEVVANFILVGNLVIVLMEVERVMESSCGELHAHCQGQLIERQHILGIVVAHRTAKADVLQSHVLQRQQRAQALVEAACMSAQLIVLLAKSLNRDTDAYVWELLGKSDHTVFEPTRCGDDDTVGVLIALLHNIRQVFTYEGLATCQVNELQVGQALQVFCLQLLLTVCRVLPNVAHHAPHRAAVRQNNTCVSRTRNSIVTHNVVDYSTYCHRQQSTHWLI